MDSHVKQYYKQYSENSQDGHFHTVIALHNAPDINWKDISKKVPSLPRGWFELSHLQARDRIDFTRDFWMSQLPYHPLIDSFLQNFFYSLDDIGVFIVQPKYEDPYEVHLVYSLAGDNGFFRGFPPAKESNINNVKKEFPDIIFPEDYLAFLKIHNGFSKLDDTGIRTTNALKSCYNAFQEMLEKEIEPLTTTKGDSVNPKTLIPFYESFGMPFYQCFWAEWYPDQEMGNVYYSSLSKKISDCKCKDLMADSLAFPTFLDWLMFYMEKIE